MMGNRIVMSKISFKQKILSFRHVAYLRCDVPQSCFKQLLISKARRNKGKKERLERRKVGKIVRKKGRAKEIGLMFVSIPPAHALLHLSVQLLMCRLSLRCLYVYSAS